MSDGYITVGKLRKLLVDVADDVLVVMSKGAEGNGYSPLSDVSVGGHLYDSDTTWSGELVEVDEGIYEGADATTEAVPCVVLWPTN